MKLYYTAYLKTILAIIGSSLCIHGMFAQEINPKLLTDPTSIYVLMDYPHIATKSISFSNTGTTDLRYELSIDYVRKADWNKGKEKEGQIIPDSIPISKKIQYVDTLLLSASYGGKEQEALTIATKFKGGTDGFNVSDVGTWFFCESVKEGTISVEIRAGGNSIEEAFTIAQGSLKYKIEGSSLNGKLLNIKLDKCAAIYPNEEFYVVMTFPKGIRRPQGCVVNDKVEQVAERYMVHDNGQWRDIQSDPEYAKCGLIMYAAERLPNNKSWITITSSKTGRILSGGHSSLNMRINGSRGNLGAQYADVVFNLRDSVDTMVRVPVTLRRNEAPYFEGAPEELLIVEDSTVVLLIELVDYEGDKFTVEPLQGCKVGSYIIKDSLLTLTIAPKRGDAGTYEMKFKATDEHKLERILTVKIHVSQPPVYTGSRPLVLSFAEDSVRFSIHDLFVDPDGDSFSFTVASADESILTVSKVSDSIFVVKPKKVGEGALLFSLNDARGSSAIETVDVLIGECLQTEGIVRQKWNSVLFVDNSSGSFAPDGYQWYMNREEILGATKQYYSSENEIGQELDYSAEYYVRMVTVAGDTVYSCPVYPTKRSLLVSASPNPVTKGGTIHVQADVPESTDQAASVQFFNLNGQLEKSLRVKGDDLYINAPDKQGIYLMRVRIGNNTKTLIIKVD